LLRIIRDRAELLQPDFFTLAHTRSCIAFGTRRRRYFMSSEPLFAFATAFLLLSFSVVVKKLDGIGRVVTRAETVFLLAAGPPCNLTGKKLNLPVF
jgi:hypothetical protein